MSQHKFVFRPQVENYNRTRSGSLQKVFARHWLQQVSFALNTRLSADHSYAFWTAVGWPQLKAVTGDHLVMARFHGWTRQVLSFASSNS